MIGVAEMTGAKHIITEKIFLRFSQREGSSEGVGQSEGLNMSEGMVGSGWTSGPVFCGESYGRAFRKFKAFHDDIKPLLQFFNKTGVAL